VIEEWVTATQSWMNARFADWDTRNPQETEFVVLNECYGAELGTPRTALTESAPRPAPAAKSSSPVNTEKPLATSPQFAAASRPSVRPVSFVRKRVIFERLLPGESEPNDVAYQLNRRNEGIGISPPPIMRRILSRAAFEPLPAGDDLYPGIAYELNRQQDGILIKPVWASHSAVAKSDLHPSRVGFGGMETCESLYFAGPLEKHRSIAPSIARQLSKVPALAGKPDHSIEVPWVPGWGTMVFNDEIYAASTSEPEKPKSPQVGPVATSSHAPLQNLFALEGIDDLWLETAGAIADDIDGFSASPRRPAAERASEIVSYAGTELGEDLFDDLAEGMIEDGTETAAPARSGLPIVSARSSVSTGKSSPLFAPLEVADDLYVGLAYELNLWGERGDQPGMTIASVKLPPSNVTPSVRELGRAVKLTRDALSAWFNVFTGPAIVTASK
jgi:hypothetical protein